MLELLQMVIGMKPGAPVDPLPMVVATGRNREKDANLLKTLAKKDV
jgi:hypothetical protein